MLVHIQWSHRRIFVGRTMFRIDKTTMIKHASKLIEKAFTNDRDSCHLSKGANIISTSFSFGLVDHILSKTVIGAPQMSCLLTDLTMIPAMLWRTMRWKCVANGKDYICINKDSLSESAAMKQMTTSFHLSFAEDLHLNSISKWVNKARWLSTST